ncbi:MAG: pantoate--beta-alanine ligase, partial [Alphaproteobacteria bacterium]
DLIPIKNIANNKNFRVFVSVYIGQTRLIDNIKLY